MKKLWCLLLALALALTLSACGDKETMGTAAPEITPTPTVSAPPPTSTPEPEYEGPLNPLTGLPMPEAYVGKRPVAIMLNNLRKAMPQQGQSQADIIYETLEEGGITRMMGVYQSLDELGTIGSIRSTRTYYLQLALGHDAVLIHAGGSDEPKYEDAYGKIREWGVTNLDGVRGPYMSNTEGGALMWRDPGRVKKNGSVHSVVTTGEKLRETFTEASFRTEHKEGFAYEMAFADDGAPAGGADAGEITVPFSQEKTGMFRYDEASGRYLVEEYGEPYIDGNTGEQVGVTNVVVLKTAVDYTGDSYGHITVDLYSGGTGYFACGGKAVDILWSKDYPDGQLRYTDLQGEPVVFGRGTTYVNIIPDNQKVTFS